MSLNKAVFLLYGMWFCATPLQINQLQGCQIRGWTYNNFPVDDIVNIGRVSRAHYEAPAEKKSRQ